MEATQGRPVAPAASAMVSAPRLATVVPAPEPEPADVGDAQELVLEGGPPTAVTVDRSVLLQFVA